MSDTTIKFGDSDESEDGGIEANHLRHFAQVYSNKQLFAKGESALTPQDKGRARTESGPVLAKILDTLGAEEQPKLHTEPTHDNPDVEQPALE